MTTAQSGPSDLVALLRAKRAELAGDIAKIDAALAVFDQATALL